jgi:uncharacterized lipoprotein YajG
MKYLHVLALALFAALLAGCASQETSTQQQPTASSGKDCVKRTGSNLCS